VRGIVASPEGDLVAEYSLTVSPSDRCVLCGERPAAEAYRLGTLTVSLPTCAPCEEHALDLVAALWAFDSVLFERSKSGGSAEWFLALERSLKATVATTI
jgi:hypothetical protein